VAKVPGFELPLAEVRASLETLRRPLRIAILRFRNPFNVGAIIRVAHSFLVQEILLVGDEPYYERAAMGMQRYENLIKLADENALVAWARERKLPLIAFEREHARVDLWRAELPEACVMVFGSETSGVSEQLLAEVDDIVAIPMYGINNSFPVTVAAGIAMAEWTRRYFVNIGGFQGVAANVGRARSVPLADGRGRGEAAGVGGGCGGPEVPRAERVSETDRRCHLGGGAKKP
jgi:tRNA(Leu) C34 or U34 (ribose-2'-O)-methylase TrmL